MIYHVEGVLIRGEWNVRMSQICFMFDSCCSEFVLRSQFVFFFFSAFSQFIFLCFCEEHLGLTKRSQGISLCGADFEFQRFFILVWLLFV